MFWRPSINAQTCLTDILKEYVVPFAPFIDYNFQFMHDNTQPHIANVVRDFLNDGSVRALEWQLPARN